MLLETMNMLFWLVWTGGVGRPGAHHARIDRATRYVGLQVCERVLVRCHFRAGTFQVHRWMPFESKHHGAIGDSPHQCNHQV